MRRRVRGTVSGIYMYSAALRRGSKRRHGSTALACLATKRVLSVFLWPQNTPQIAYFTPLAHVCERSSAEGSLLISRDNLTMINGSIVKRHAGRYLRRGAGAKCQRRRARIASRRRRRVGRELRPVGVRPPRADATELLLSPRGRALEEASRASGLGLPGDGIAGSRYGVERIDCRELQHHGPMSRARGTVYVLGFNAQYAEKPC